MATKELIVEELRQQIPGQHPEPCVPAFGEPEEPAERFELLELRLVGLGEPCSGVNLLLLDTLGARDPELPPLAEKDQDPEAPHHVGALLELVENHLGRGDVVNQEVADLP